MLSKMVDVRLLIERAEKERELRRQSVKRDEVIIFAGKTFSLSTDFTKVTEPDLILSHSIIHMAYHNKKCNIGFIKSLHESIFNEMGKRKLNHGFFDKLDKK